MTPQQFISKWKPVRLSERSACQQHFCDLCDLFGHEKPAAFDPEGAEFTFERGVRTTDGATGFADVWKRNFFGWEYKRRRKDLDVAYRQLLLYREDLDNPPLLIVSDMDRFQVHTNFTGTPKHIYSFTLDELSDRENLKTLRSAFFEPENLKPGETREAITRQAAELFGQLADGMRARGVATERAAQFLMKLMFCMFAEDIGLLPNSVFSKTLDGARGDPARLSKLLRSLFSAMVEGGFFGTEDILHFDGGLFANADTVELQPSEIAILRVVNRFDWADVEPSIFGTLFERTLDPEKRSQIGAHYTSREDIETLLHPVLTRHLRREWMEVKAECDGIWSKIVARARKRNAPRRLPRGVGKGTPERRAFNRRIRQFIERLASISILDPACGSGNFLYVALHLLLDLEKEVIAYSSARGYAPLPQVRPTQLSGIERNPYAQQLAQVAIWIGYLQWMFHSGFLPPRNPVLEPIESIRCADAILNLSGAVTVEPEWPEAEFVVGNPPFLGTKKLRSELGDEYVEALFRLYEGRVPNFGDICCYWFEKTRDAIESGGCKRAGLLATQGIRGGLNREVLNRIKRTGDIFFAESDRDWILDGAHVHVSMVGFDDGTETERILDGQSVAQINSNLTATADVTRSKRLKPNAAIGFIADVKAGRFDISFEDVRPLLSRPNPNGKPNSNVLRPWANGRDVVQRSNENWIIDFGWEMPLNEAAMYEAPFEIVNALVRPARKKVKRKRYREYWWLHAEPCAEMRRRLDPLERFLVTPTVSKHRVFVWMSPAVLPDHQLVAFARSDDYFFGIVHSRVHEVWARAQGTQVRERESGFRYTPTTCFETFPFPKPGEEQNTAVAAAARELDGLRARWLNPPEWTREEVLEFPGSTEGPWHRYLQDPDEYGVGIVRFPRTVPKDQQIARELKRRTLTNLYNERPTWLENAHRKLDEAVIAAYGWHLSESNEQILAALLELNLSRSSR